MIRSLGMDPDKLLSLRSEAPMSECAIGSTLSRGECGMLNDRQRKAPHAVDNYNGRGKRLPQAALVCW